MTKVADGGRLAMKMAWQAGTIVAVDGQLRRPVASALLVGRAPDEAQALVPLIFSLCGKAQAAAARAACGAAAGQPLTDDELDTAGRRVAAEAGQEHLWRLLRDWPPLLGLPARDADFAVWFKRLGSLARAAGTGTADDLALETAKALQAYLRDALFGVDPAAVHDLSDLPAATYAGRMLAVLDELPPAPDAATPRLLPARRAADWAAELARAPADFVARPALAGFPAETGALARQAARPLVATRLAARRLLAARLAARLLDLAALPATLAGAPPRLDACSPTPGLGVGCVDTARGLLIHAVRLEHGVIADYTVIAPTEWNFHPAGRWRAELPGLPAADRGAAEHWLRRLVLALDPCVPVSFAVVDTVGAVPLSPPACATPAAPC